MRPIKLLMSAFGPYSREQKIDFEELEGQNIFLITGPTGAGKTTIFDAISYALFAEASGSTREIDTLRSDFADNDVETFVELDFEFRNKIYKIRRVPKQMKKKLRGEGFTERAAEGFLELPDGKIVNGYSNVTTEIKNLLGIDENQFKQIVMLPQGEFKKLLLAKSSEKEEIFRKIFGTENFQKFQRRLKDKADKLRKEVSKFEDEVKTNLKGIKSFDYVLELDENIDYNSKLEEVKSIIDRDKKSERTLKKEIEKIDKEIEDINLKFNNGRSINDQLEKKEKLKQELVVLRDREEHFNNLEYKLKKAKKALEIIPIENFCEEKNQEKLKKQKIISELEDYFKALASKYNTICEELKLEENREEERKQISKEIIELEGKRQKFLQLEEQKILFEELKNGFNKLNELEIKQKNEIDEIKLKKIRNEKELDLINDAKLRAKDIFTNKEFTSNQIKELEELYKLIKKLNKYTEVNEKNKLEYIEKESEYRRGKDIFEKQDLLYRSHQAGILAKDLKDNEACPVCGSKIHPNKAILTEVVLTEADLKKLKKEIDLLENVRNEVYTRVTESNKVLKTYNDDVVLKSIEKINELYNYKFNLGNKILSQLIVEGKEVRSKFNILNEKYNKLVEIINDEENKIKEKENLEMYLSNIENERIQLEEKIREDTGRLESVRGLVQSLSSELPKEILSVRDLDQIIKNKECMLQQMEKKFKLAIKAKEEIESKRVELESTIKNERNNLEETNNNLEERKNKLTNIIKRLEFKSYNEYNSYKLSQKEIDELQKEINEYKNNIKLKEELLQNKDKETIGLVRVDLNKFNEELHIKKGIKEEKEKLKKQVYSYIDNNRYRYDEAKRLREHFVEKEEEYRVLGELANLSNAKIKPYITFESYVLAAYFEEILSAANIRLSKMTNDRFILKRKEDNYKGAGQKGLDLEVFDNNTGKLRNVTSLSGGETFKASLSLALGLSDIIQSTSGGIKLDTMFVDEGFGTLDPESLDSAIESLLELQSDGRLVGIISHVSELKETIEKQLIITPSAKGSYAEFK